MRSWKPLSVLVSASALLAAAALVDTPTARAGDTQCGEEGQPMCPLQGWMDKNVQAALEAGKLDELAKLLGEKVPKAVPDKKWNDGDQGWSKLAKEGADAAKAGDKKAVMATCKSCHKAWREKYKDAFRTKPLPKGF